MERFIKKICDTDMADVPQVGVTNAFLGELYNKLSSKGLCIPEGFALTAAAYQYYISYNGLEEPLQTIIKALDTNELTNLGETAASARRLIMGAKFPKDLELSITTAYKELLRQRNQDVSVRSNPIDVSNTIIAAGHESFFNIKGDIALIYAIKRCYASLYTEEAIKSREVNRMQHEGLSLSIGIQQMIRSDLGCSGRGVTNRVEPTLAGAVYLNGTWGLGEFSVGPTATLDEFLIAKPTSLRGKVEIVKKKLGKKNTMVIYNETPAGTDSTLSTITPRELRERFILEDPEVTKLAYWALLIEDQYKFAVNFEWAKDGNTQELFLVQARPVNLPETLRESYSGINF